MNLLERFKALLTAQDDPETAAHSIELATAILLFEVVWADHDIADSELAQLNQSLVDNLGLASEEVEEIVAQVRQEQEQHVGVYAFTRTINEACSAEEKFALTVSLWRVALADGQISAIEEHTIRRISDLLYVPHRDFIRAKQVARDT